MDEQLPAIVERTEITARAHIVPALITVAGERASLRFLEFFAANIRNPHTRRAYSRAVSEFMAWCDDNGVTSEVDPIGWTGIGLSEERLSAISRSPARRGVTETILTLIFESLKAFLAVVGPVDMWSTSLRCPHIHGSRR